MTTTRLVPRVCSVCGDEKMVRADSLVLATKPLMCRDCSRKLRSATHGIKIAPRDMTTVHREGLR